MTAQVVNYETVWDMVKKLSLIQKRQMFNDLSRSIVIEDDAQSDEDLERLKEEYVVEGGLSEAIYQFWTALPPQTSEITDEELEDMRYEALMERHPL